MSRASAVRLSCIVITTPRIRSAGIRPLPHLLDRLEQVVRPLEREVRRLDRDQEMRRRDQRVDRQQAERRRTVDDDVRVLAVERLDLVLQSEVRVELAHQPRLELREADPRRRDEQVGDRRRPDDVRELARRFGNRVVGAPRDRAEIEKRNAAVGLRVEIDEQRLPAPHGQRGGEVHGGRRLADAALLIGDRNDHRQC